MEYSRDDFLPVYPEYRGGFQAVARFSGSGESFECLVGVFDGSFCDVGSADSDSAVPSDAGVAELRWQEIVPGPREECRFSLPRRRWATVAAMPFRPAAADGWIVLQMTRVAAGPADCGFEDAVLGTVNLRFDWLIAERIPEISAERAVLAVAALRIDADSGNVEIRQLHHGIPSLWIPLEAGSAESSSSLSPSFSGSESSAELSGSGESSTSSAVVVDPPESSSSHSTGHHSSGWEESSSSESSSSSSESQEGAELVTVTAELFSKLDFTDESFSDASCTTSLSGAFSPAGRAADGSFAVSMHGVSISLEGEREISRSQISTVWIVYPNAELNRWEIRVNGDLLAELAYHDYESEDGLETDRCVRYDFPPLEQNVPYPRGSIAVRRENIYCIAADEPYWSQTDESVIAFSAFPSGSDSSFAGDSSSAGSDSSSGSDSSAESDSLSASLSDASEPVEESGLGPEGEPA